MLMMHNTTPLFATQVLMWVGTWDFLTGSKLNHLKTNHHFSEGWTQLQQTWTYLVLGWLLSVWSDNVCMQASFR
jgi:hypothetical protein